MWHCSVGSSSSTAHPRPRLLFDRGSISLSDVASELIRSEGDSRVLTSSYHPQTDGKNENPRKLILAQMRSFATDDPRD